MKNFKIKKGEVTRANSYLKRSDRSWGIQWFLDTDTGEIFAQVTYNTWVFYGEYSSVKPINEYKFGYSSLKSDFGLYRSDLILAEAREQFKEV